MALNATLHSLEIQLSDSDRGVYQALAFRVAQHPSETRDYLVTRVLAYCLEYTQGLAFSRGGLAEPDEPALTIRDLSGTLTNWIEVGLPEAARLHKAAKSAARVVVYPHRDPGAWLARIRSEAIHRMDRIEIYAIDRELIAALVARLSRRMRFDCVSSERHLYLSFDDGTIDGSIARLHLSDAV
ncbi:MAG TPA: YaeQ family protein [Steroidobacteraceae bacterium]|nr:YaeQ family protein [Steroidobacteraceae bacterium]